jgi:integrase
MKEAGLVQEIEIDGEKRVENLYTPYSLRHFYASMLIADNKDLKTIQERLGHVDAAMTSMSMVTSSRSVRLCPERKRAVFSGVFFHKLK